MPATQEPVRSDPWAGLVDDAAIFPPGDVPLPAATAAYAARTAGEGAGLVGTFVLRDTDLPQVRGFGAQLSVVVTGGAGQVAGPAGLCGRLGLALAGLEIALRDLDDLPGNARRVIAAVDAARAEGALADDVPVYVELPAAEPTHQWLAAADEVAGAELRLKFRTGGVEAHQVPSSATLAAWVDAALDRETPFKCTAGLHHAVRHDAPLTGSTSEASTPHGRTQSFHGFLNVLAATRLAFDGASRDEVEAVLESRDGPALAASDLTGARRWFTSFGSCSIDEPLADLRTLGLVS